MLANRRFLPWQKCPFDGSNGIPGPFVSGEAVAVSLTTMPYSIYHLPYSLRSSGSLDVLNVLVLMRAKGNRTPEERLAHMCAGPVFQHLRKIDANFLDRVRIVRGDLQKPCVGIEDVSTLQWLKEEIDIVIHAAADVRFNEPLYDLILCNLYGTRELLELSKQMRRLQVFVYMSTAFSNCKAAAEEDIAEEFYPPPLDADVLIDYVRTRRTDMDRELLRILSPNLIKPWPNNYTFSKALSESIVRRYGTAFPICVIRPTIGTH